MSNTNRLLTIGVPTYNRSTSLSLMLRKLSTAIYGYEKDIEVIISDNCSTDDTPRVVKKWIEGQCVDLSVRSLCQLTNLGVSRNLVSLLYASTSNYFLFLGDDDCLYSENFPKLLSILKDKHPSAVIQSTWPGKNSIYKAESISFSEALSLLYEYGNAWGGVVDTASAIDAIESRSLRHEIETIVWPQIVFGYLAMFDLEPMRRIEAVDFEIGRPLGESLNITNKSYWIRSLTDLLKAAAIIQSCTRTKALRKRFISCNSRGVVGHIQSIFLNSLVDGDKTSLLEIQNLLSRHFGWRGWVLAWFLVIDTYHSVLRTIAGIFWFLFKKNEYDSLFFKIEHDRRQRKLDILDKGNSGKRYGDWF